MPENRPYQAYNHINEMKYNAYKMSEAHNKQKWKRKW